MNQDRQTKSTDMRGWLEEVDKMGELVRIDGADWNQEIGCIAELNREHNAPALLFDSIKDYPKGYRVVASSLQTVSRISHTFSLPICHSIAAILTLLRQKFPEWKQKSNDFPPEVVNDGPVLENVHAGKEVNLLEFPTPKWHDHDGGRYIGTGHAVITQDPDSGVVNLGTYRMMLHDEKTTGLYMAPNKHGGIHIEKYHQRGQPCPIAVSLGHHPLLFGLSCNYTPGPEYEYTGVIRGKPVRVIREELTGLPIPADSEIVIAGFCPPQKTKMEGSFGEWTGYYAGKEKLAPIIEVERVYHRNAPILLGCVTGRPPGEYGILRGVLRGIMLQNELTNAGIPDVKCVWIHEAAGNPILVVSIKQRYAGHAKQVAALAANSRMAGVMNRYVIVVDDDIDPTNTMDVLWALGSRTNPAEDIDILRRVWSSPLDPTIRKPAPVLITSKAIIDACKPYEWMDEFPKEVKASPELQERVKKRWGSLLKL